MAFGTVGGGSERANFAPSSVSCFQLYVPTPADASSAVFLPDSESIRSTCGMTFYTPVHRRNALPSPIAYPSELRRFRMSHRLRAPLAFAIALTFAGGAHALSPTGSALDPTSL